MTAVSPTITIEEFTCEREGAPLFYRQNGDGTVPDRRGDDHGAVLVRLDVDGWTGDVVAVDLRQSSDVRVLSRAIEALTLIRDKLAEINPQGSYGRCMSAGEWGRCKLRDGHEVDGDHLFPTEEEWRTELEVLEKASKA
jgi:hypothetical protein